MPEQPKFLRITDIQNDSVDWQKVPTCVIDEVNEKKKSLQSGDIVIARTGNTGKSFLVKSPPRAVFASYLLRVRSYGDAMPQYLKAFFGCDDYWRQIIANTMGAVQPNVNASRLGNLEVPLPPLPEQKRIVSILNEQLAVVERAKKAAVERLEAARALRDAFLAALFRDRVHPGTGWKQLRLGDVCTVVTGNTPAKAKPNFYGGDIPWVNPGHLGLSKYVRDSHEYLTSEGVQSARVVPEGSVLVTCISGSRANIGKSAIAAKPLTTNQQINSIVTGPTIESEFLYYQILAISPRLQALAANTNQNIVNKSKLESITVHVPPLEIQRQVSMQLRQQFEIADSVERAAKDSLEGLSDLSSVSLQRAF